MWNMVIRFVVIALVAIGAVWLAERPGTLTFDWLGYTVEISIMVALTLLALALFAIVLVWSIVRRVFNIPSALSGFFTRRKRENVHEALTKGIIAVGAGDEERRTGDAVEDEQQARRAVAGASAAVEHRDDGVHLQPRVLLETAEQARQAGPSPEAANVDLPELHGRIMAQRTRTDGRPCPRLFRDAA